MMVDNIEKVISRGERLEDLGEVSDALILGGEIWQGRFNRRSSLEMHTTEERKHREGLLDAGTHFSVFWTPRWLGHVGCADNIISRCGLRLA